MRNPALAVAAELTVDTCVSRSVTDHSAATNYLGYRPPFPLLIVRHALAEATRGSWRSVVVAVVYVLVGKRDRGCAPPIPYTSSANT